MKISKYFYIYLGLALMMISTLILSNLYVKYIFILIMGFLLSFLVYDFFDRKLSFSLPKIADLMWELFILFVIYYNLNDVFELNSIYLILFIVLYTIKIFFTPRWRAVMFSNG